MARMVCSCPFMSFQLVLTCYLFESLHHHVIEIKKISFQILFNHFLNRFYKFYCTSIECLGNTFSDVQRKNILLKYIFIFVFQKESIIFALYESNWMDMDIKCRNLILFTMRLNNAHKQKMKFSRLRVVNMEMIFTVCNYLLISAYKYYGHFKIVSNYSIMFKTY